MLLIIFAEQFHSAVCKSKSRDGLRQMLHTSGVYGT